MAIYHFYYFISIYLCIHLFVICGVAERIEEDEEEKKRKKRKLRGRGGESTKSNNTKRERRGRTMGKEVEKG